MDRPTDIFTGLPGYARNCMRRAFEGEPVTAEMIQSMSDVELAAVGNLGVKGLAVVRAAFPFDAEMEYQRQRFVGRVPVRAPTPLVLAGDLNAVYRIAGTVGTYYDELIEEGFSTDGAQAFTAEMHTRLMAYWFPRREETTLIRRTEDDA